MSLQSRLATLITDIGADIKSLRAVDNRRNAAVANQSISGNSDTYITGSFVTFPTGKIKAKSTYRLKFNVVKTAAGSQAPVLTVRVGTAGTTSDTNRAQLTFDSQSGAIDEGVFEIDCTFRTAGGTATIQALGKLMHRLITTGLNSVASNTFKLNTGGSFDVTGANLGIGCSINPGASAAWTVSLVTAELVDITA